MRRPLLFLGMLILLVVILHVAELLPRGQSGASGPAAFQQLLGGLGMGATPAIYWDFSSYDPRLEPNCACSRWPVPGGYPFSPEHGTTIWHPPGILYVEPRSITSPKP